MSTKTTNFEFLKPELSDSADITKYNVNWDKVDEELKNRVSSIATYYPPSSGNMLANDLTVPFALVPVSTSVNEDLHKIVGGSFAWVWTNFYVEQSTTTRRLQIAMSYNNTNQKMAFRIYANDWTAWKEVATSDTLPKTAEAIGAAKSDLSNVSGEVIVQRIEDSGVELDTASKSINNIVITSTGWVDETETTALFRYRITNANILENMSVDVLFKVDDYREEQASSLVRATNGGVLNATTADVGYVDIYSTAQLDTDLVCDLVLTQLKVV